MDFGVALLLHRPRTGSINGGHSPEVTFLSSRLGFPSFRSDLPELGGIHGLALTLKRSAREGMDGFPFSILWLVVLFTLIIPVFVVRELLPPALGAR